MPENLYLKVRTATLGVSGEELRFSCVSGAVKSAVLQQLPEAFFVVKLWPRKEVLRLRRSFAIL